MGQFVNRRDFIAGATSVAVSALSGCRATAGARPVATGEIWANLLHMGWNMWVDKPHDPSKHPGHGEADCIRFDRSVWNRLTERMAEIGMNVIVMDLGEFMVLPSHPELAVRGSWSPDEMRTELARLRGLGLEPVPKCNFSTAHDTWLKDYHRMVSTSVYYRVCADVIRDVCEIFDRPRFFHLGYDEETATNHVNHRYCVVRQGELWWHDLDFFARTCLDLGMRPWIWADAWTHKGDEFIRRMSKDVLLSGWYYKLGFENDKDGFWSPLWREFAAFERAGFDQIPCSSNFFDDGSFEGLVARCDKLIAPQRLKGYLMAPWKITLPGEYERKNLAALDQVVAAMKIHKANGRQEVKS